MAKKILFFLLKVIGAKVRVEGTFQKLLSGFFPLRGATSEEPLSHLGHCWATPAGAANKGVITPVLRNGVKAKELETDPKPARIPIFVFAELARPPRRCWPTPRSRRPSAGWDFLSR